MKAIKFKRFKLAIALCAVAANAFAATPISICVSNTDDSGPGSLRAAITQVNTSKAGGYITFCLTNAPTNTITLLSALPSLTNITGIITITGPGTNLLTISGGNLFGVFSMNGGTTNILSDLTIADALVSNAFPEGVYMYGAGISNAGSLTLLSCAITNCILESRSGLVRGAGIYNVGDLVMSNCTVTGCSTDPSWDYDGDSGGGIANDGALIMEDCAVLRCGAENGAGVETTGSARLARCIIESCLAIGSAVNGIGICQDGGTVLLQSCIISNCSGSTFVFGGGVCSFGESLAATNCTFVGNYADMGGGLYLGGTSILSGCTISGNLLGEVGGGVINYGTLTMLNCTVSGNEGGAISGGALMNYCTIVSNTPFWNGSSENIQAQNTIFAGNGSNDIFGVLTSEGYNLIQNTNGCTIAGDETGNIYGEDPLLGPLQDNGGPTWTHALLRGSPAIDAGSTNGMPATDQRGIHRPQGLAPDIGAFEFQYVTPVIMGMTLPVTKLKTPPSFTNCVTMCGLAGGIYTLQASTNLVTWTSVPTISNRFTVMIAGTNCTLVATNVADTNGVCMFTEIVPTNNARRFYRILVPGPMGSLYIPTPSGILDAPFLVTNSYIWQTVPATTAADGGRAEYPFTLANAGNYVLRAMVNSPNDAANSFFVNIDAEPQEPTMIWDVFPYTSSCGFEARAVSWRGDGTDGADQFVPMIFYLTNGPHQLIIRGRESYTLLQSISIVPTNAPAQ